MNFSTFMTRLSSLRAQPKARPKALPETRGYFIFGCMAISAFFSLKPFHQAHAETRVYELIITDTDSGRTRIVTTTLDNYQYPDYHSVKPRERVDIQDSWMCFKRSDHYQRHCPNPRAPAGR